MAGRSESSEDSDGDNFQRGLDSLAMNEDPRTLSQIKRSRIDLSRRYVFLCPTSLCKHFDAIPQQGKDSALLVFRCSRDRLFVDRAAVRKRLNEPRLDSGMAKKKSSRARSASPKAKGTIRALTATASEFSQEFLQWVLSKEKEGRVFWFKPDRDVQRLSTFFTQLTDPTTGQPYKPLLLDPQWWRVRFSRATARYVGNPATVISNISEKSMPIPESRDLDIPALQELIYQSNPSLEPIAWWPHAPSMRFLPKSGPKRRDYRQTGSHYRGYIDQDSTRMGLDSHLMTGAKGNAANTRISCWPEQPGPLHRLDNLHHMWQHEDSISARRQASIAVAARGILSAR